MEVINKRLSLSYCRDRWVLMLATLCLLLFALSGCAKVGPRSISMGRGDYNQAIDQEFKEMIE